MEDSGLWRAAEIGAYLKLSPKTVQNKVLRIEGFPAPRLLKIIGNKEVVKRWVAEEVREWALKQGKTD